MPPMPPESPTGDAPTTLASFTHPLVDGTPGAALVPGYELREEIGRGGMGVVFRARDQALAREVAVKLLLDGYASDSALARRFVEEAQITGQLQHPGIPAVHQTGTTPDGRPFLAMKLVKGRTLADLLADRPDPAADRSRFLAIFEHVCHAVGYAHAHDVIHRDLKPSNIMVGAFDEVQVMDWGLAKVVNKEAAPLAPATADPEREITRTEIGPRRHAELATQAGSLLGTPAFMSPEQAGGEADRIGPRSDVFGLGAILCVLLTGEPPYRGPGGEAIRLQAIRGQLGDAFARLDACGAEPELVALAKRCLADLAERPANGAEVADAVARLRTAAEERARRAELERAAAEVRIAEQRKRRRVWYALAAVFFLSAVASVLLAVRARQAEARALTERDLKEKAREEAVANEEKARGAEAARRLELGRTAAAAAQLAAGRGQWKESLQHYETALAVGGGDEIGLKLGRLDCRLALGQLRPALAELDELAARADLGRFAGPVLLRKAETALARQGGDDPRDLARQALAKGLPPADASYARVFLVETAPEAIKLLQEASRLDPFHCRGLDCLATLLFITGRREEFRQTLTQVRLSRPDSVNHLMLELFSVAMNGDRATAGQLLSRLGKTDQAELMPLFRIIVDFLVRAQDEDFAFVGVPPLQLVSLASEYARMAKYFSRISGEKNAGDARPGNMHFLQLPMFKALGELPPFKGLLASGPLGSVATLRQPAKMADILGAVARAIPDGTFLTAHGFFLHEAGRLPQAEAVLRRAVDSPSWANHRRAARFHLVRTQWQLAISPRTPAKEQALWKEKALANVRDLAFSGKEPLPPQPTSQLVNVAFACGDHALGLALTEAALRKKPKDLTLQGWKLNLELGLGALDRAETTARVLTAILEPRNEQHRPGWDALLNLARAYHDAGRRADARRWCDTLHERLTRAGGDDSDLLDAWNGLGVVYWRMKQLDQSIPIFERIWAARRKARGERHPETLQAQINLGVNYRDAGRLKEAIPLLEQVTRQGRAQPSLHWARGELFSAYVAAGKLPEARTLVNESLAAARKELPADSVALAGALALGAGGLLQMKDYREAESILREVLRIREKAAPEAWTTYNTRSMLGEALAGQKKFADAQRLLVQGFAGLKKQAAQIPAAVRTVRLVEAADRLVRLYEALGKKEEAAKWRKERETIGKP